ncbi:MAG: OsmC family protein [Candidatus Baltobacteraceae bacterium]
MHNYHVRLTWTGSNGIGTTSYRSYGRDYEVAVEGKAPMRGSADPQYRGDATLWNPEELFLASLSACHQLWYLHLCADAGVVVRNYEDCAESSMIVHGDGSGEVVSVLLRPTVTILAGSDRERAISLHDEAAKMCFIARSVNFPVVHEPTIACEREAS